MPPSVDDLSRPLPDPFEPEGPERRLASAKVVAALTAFLGLLLFSTLGFTVQALNIGFGLWFTELFIFLGVPWVLLRFSGRDPARYVGLAAPSPWVPAYGFLLGVVNFFAVVVPLQFLSQSVAPEWLREMYDASQIFKNQTPFELVLIISGVGLAAPLCEETFFRGVVQRGFMSGSVRPVAAVMFTAIIFSAFHLDPVGFLARVELGALFGLLYLRSGSLWPGVAAHSANNLVSTVLYFAFEGTADRQSEGDLAEILMVAITGAGALAAVLWLPRRFPALLPPRALEEAPASGPTPSLARLAAPWVAVAVAGLVVLVGVDSRGISLNFSDYRHRLPNLEEDAPPEAKRERQQLEELRARARAGEVPVEEYVQKRRELAARESGSASPPAPVPPSPP